MLTSPGFVLIILQVTQLPKVNSPTSNPTPYPNPLRGVWPKPGTTKPHHLPTEICCARKKTIRVLTIFSFISFVNYVITLQLK